MHPLHSAAILHLLSWLLLLFSGVLELHDRQEMPPKDYSNQTCEIPEIAPQALPLPVSLHHHTAPRTVQRTQASHFYTVPIASLLLAIHSNDPDHPPVQAILLLTARIGHRPLPQLQFSRPLDSPGKPSSLLARTSGVLTNHAELGAPSLQSI